MCVHIYFQFQKKKKKMRDLLFSRYCNFLSNYWYSSFYTYFSLGSLHHWNRHKKKVTCHACGDPIKLFGPFRAHYFELQFFLEQVVSFHRNLTAKMHPSRWRLCLDRLVPLWSSFSVWNPLKTTLSRFLFSFKKTLRNSLFERKIQLSRR